MTTSKTSAARRCCGRWRAASSNCLVWLHERNTRMGPSPRERLIVALDLPSVEAAEAMIERLGDTVSFSQIGYYIPFAGGPAACRGESIVKLGVTSLTIHAYPQTMRAAVEAKAGSQLKLLAVTVLTSYD